MSFTFQTKKFYYNILVFTYEIDPTFHPKQRVQSKTSAEISISIIVNLSITEKTQTLRHVNISFGNILSQVEVPDRKSICPDRPRRKVPMSRLSCVQDQTFVRSPDYSCVHVQTFVRFSLFPDHANLNARHPRRAFIWVWTYRLSVWDLNLGLQVYFRNDSEQWSCNFLHLSFLSIVHVLSILRRLLFFASLQKVSTTGTHRLKLSILMMPQRALYWKNLRLQ